MNRSRRAVAMVMALVALVVTSAIAVEIMRTASLYQFADRDSLRRRQAQLLAEAAIERALFARAASPEYAGEIWEPQPEEGVRRPSHRIFRAEIRIHTDGDPSARGAPARIVVTAIVGESEIERALYQLETPVTGTKG